MTSPLDEAVSKLFERGGELDFHRKAIGEIVKPRLDALLVKVQEQLLKDSLLGLEGEAGALRAFTKTRPDADRKTLLTNAKKKVDATYIHALIAFVKQQEDVRKVIADVVEDATENYGLPSKLEQFWTKKQQDDAAAAKSTSSASTTTTNTTNANRLTHETNGASGHKAQTVSKSVTQSSFSSSSSSSLSTSSLASSLSSAVYPPSAKTVVKKETIKEDQFDYLLNLPNTMSKSNLKPKKPLINKKVPDSTPEAKPGLSSSSSSSSSSNTARTITPASKTSLPKSSPAPASVSKSSNTTSTTSLLKTTGPISKSSSSTVSSTTSSSSSSSLSSSSSTSSSLSSAASTGMAAAVPEWNEDVKKDYNEWLTLLEIKTEMEANQAWVDQCAALHSKSKTSGNKRGRQSTGTPPAETPHAKRHSTTSTSSNTAISSGNHAGGRRSGRLSAQSNE